MVSEDVFHLVCEDVFHLVRVYVFIFLFIFFFFHLVREDVLAVVNVNVSHRGE